MLEGRWMKDDVVLRTEEVRRKMDNVLQPSTLNLLHRQSRHIVLQPSARPHEIFRSHGDYTQVELEGVALGFAAFKAKRRKNPHTSTSPEATHRTSTLNPHTYICDTLEPTWRDYKHGARKIKGISAIPEGRYAVVITWSPRMKQWLPLLLGVPMFSGIRIHAGNTAADTAGCILVGENLKKGMVLNSRIWLKRLKEKIVEAKARGEGVWITII